MDYRDYNDYELLSYVAENNEEANDIIFKKYEPLIITTAKKMCNDYSLDLNDLVQEGRLALSEAISKYNSNRDTSFYTFASICIRRKILSYVLQTTRLKQKNLKESITIDFDDESFKTDMILSDDSYNPEARIMNYEEEKELIEKIRNVLTEFEQQVFNLKLASFSYKEIAVILEKDIKAIDNAIQRIKNKVKGILKT